MSRYSTADGKTPPPPTPDPNILSVENTQSDDSKKRTRGPRQKPSDDDKKQPKSLDTKSSDEARPRRRATTTRKVKTTEGERKEDKPANDKSIDSTELPKVRKVSTRGSPENVPLAPRRLVSKGTNSSRRKLAPNIRMRTSRAGAMIRRMISRGRDDEKESGRRPIAVVRREEEGKSQAKTDGGNREDETTRRPSKYIKVETITVAVEENWKDIDIAFSHSMVIRSVGRNSPLFNYLLVGDQLIEMDGKIPLEPGHFEELLEKVIQEGRPMMQMSVVRPWNVTHCGLDRKLLKKDKESMYLVVEGPQHAPPLDPKLEVRMIHGKCTVMAVGARTRASHMFLKQDRILDINGKPIGGLKELEVPSIVQNAISSVKSSFLVERQLGLRSSINTSLAADRLPSDPLFEVTGDDAVEIGAREAARFKHWKGLNLPIQSIVTADQAQGADDGNKRRKSGRRKLLNDYKREISVTPTDVKDPSCLQRVTAKSGVIGYIKNYLQKR